MRFWKFQQEHGYGYDKPKGLKESLEPRDVHSIVKGHIANQVQVHRAKKAILQKRLDGFYATEVETGDRKAKSYKPNSQCTPAQLEARRQQVADITRNINGK